VRLRGLPAGDGPLREIGTDRAELETQYRTPGSLLNRAAIYRFAVEPSDLIGEVLAQLPAPETGARVLDAGCGPGLYLARLSGWQRFGVDLSLGMARVAAGHATVAVADVQRLPFATASFDAVIAAHMLYHVPDIGAAAAELARVARRGATVLAVTNGERHLHEIGGDLRPSSLSSRFTLENGPAQLEPHLGVIRVERFRNQLRVPEAAPVVSYVDSTRSMYEPHLQPGMTWDAVLERARRRIEERIAADGFWTGTIDAGVIVCCA
jgi:SAM-dependent methyltransferase